MNHFWTYSFKLLTFANKFLHSMLNELFLIKEKRISIVKQLMFGFLSTVSNSDTKISNSSVYNELELGIFLELTPNIPEVTASDKDPADIHTSLLTGSAQKLQI